MKVKIGTTIVTISSSHYYYTVVTNSSYNYSTFFCYFSF